MSPDDDPRPATPTSPDRPSSDAGEAPGRGRPGRSAGTLRQLAVLLLGAGMIIFVWINSDQHSTVDLLFWQPEIRTAVLILVPLAAGVLLGWLQGRSGGRRRKRATRKGERKGRKGEPR